jgi:cysteine--tRNA ligase
MSKSLGNIYSLDDIKAKGYSPLDLRYFYFKAQYSNFLNFTRDALEQAKNERLGVIKKIRNLTPTE